MVKKPTKKGPSSGDPAVQDRSDRTQRILNTITNTSIILMSMLVGGLGGAMMEVIGGVASGMAGAMGGEEAQAQVEKDLQEKAPEAEEKMHELISEVRRDIYAQMKEKRQEIEPYMNDEVFDKGPEIIERYDFSLPRLSEELDDSSLAQYTQLLLKEDPCFTQMFQELTEWLNSLPQAPKKGEESKTAA